MYVQSEVYHAGLVRLNLDWNLAAPVWRNSVDKGLSCPPINKRPFLDFQLEWYLKFLFVGCVGLNTPFKELSSRQWRSFTEDPPHKRDPDKENPTLYSLRFGSWHHLWPSALKTSTDPTPFLSPPTMRIPKLLLIEVQKFKVFIK